MGNHDNHNNHYNHDYNHNHYDHNYNHDYNHGGLQGQEGHRMVREKTGQMRQKENNENKMVQKDMRCLSGGLRGQPRRGKVVQEKRGQVSQSRRAEKVQKNMRCLSGGGGWVQPGRNEL